MRLSRAVRGALEDKMGTGMGMDMGGEIGRGSTGRAAVCLPPLAFDVVVLRISPMLLRFQPLHESVISFGMLSYVLPSPRFIHFSSLSNDGWFLIQSLAPNWAAHCFM